MAAQTDQAKALLKAANLNARTVAGSIKRRARGSFATQMKTVKGKLELPQLPQVHGVWAVGMVKDEADVIEATLRHFIAQGVDAILVTDNGSTDGTLELLTRLSAEIPQLHVGFDREPAHYQAAKMTVLTDAARRAGAQWVIPFDADEFWFATEGTLKEHFAKATTPICAAKMHNLYPTDDGSFRIDSAAQYLDKMAFRPTRTATLAEGNHEVTRPGEIAESLRILHMGWRSYDQFTRKLRNGAKALALTDLPEQTGHHWRTGGTTDEATLHEMWSRLTDGNLSELGWTPVGELKPLGAQVPATWAEVAGLVDA